MVNAKNILSELKKALSDNEEVIEFNDFLSGGKRKKEYRIYLTVRTNKRGLFVKYDPMARPDTFEKEYNALTRINSNGFLTPQPIKLIDKGIVMSEITGVSLEEIVKRNGLKQSLKLLTDAVMHIALFHKKHTHRLEKGDMEKIYREVTGKRAHIEIKIVIDQASFGFTHGDLDPFNTFYDAKKSEFGLIDWEDFHENGIQELDALHFVTMLGVITNPKVSYQELYRIIFEKHKKNPYLGLLTRYCEERSALLTTILELIPVYCDVQNYRLIKAQRDTKVFLYNEFKKLYVL